MAMTGCVGPKISTGNKAAGRRTCAVHCTLCVAPCACSRTIFQGGLGVVCCFRRFVYETPMPVGRLVRQVADKHQVCTQRSWKRPFGVGMLVGGYDKTGPHLYNTCPSGNYYEYKAMAIGARSQVGSVAYGRRNQVWGFQMRSGHSSCVVRRGYCTCVGPACRRSWLAVKLYVCGCQAAGQMVIGCHQQRSKAQNLQRSMLGASLGSLTVAMVIFLPALRACAGCQDIP